MSVRKNRSIIVWVLIAVVLVAAFSSVQRLRVMWVLPGEGYRAYEWKWTIQINGMLADINNELPDWYSWLFNGILEKWDQQKDEKGDPVVIKSLQMQDYDYHEIPIQEWDFKVNVTMVFVGYFPNGVQNAIVASARNNPSLFDFLIPPAYAAGAPWLIPITIIAAAILAYFLIPIVAQFVTTMVNMLYEKQRWDDVWHDPVWVKVHDATGWWAHLDTSPSTKSPTFPTEAELDAWIANNPPVTIPPWLKMIYAIIQSVLGYLQTLGPVALFAILAIAAILILGGRGRKR